jgi:peptidoglycan/xylan/chitin deacetylase (PgdA/CDA1 family)
VRLVVIYHRVAPRDAPAYEIVPTVPLDLFRQQLTVLGELGHIVPLQDLLTQPDDSARPLRFALTFDDDYATHVRYVLPTLREFDLHASFFLSGRALHGLGAYWFERLEALAADAGLAAAADLLELTDVSEEAQLALRCEGDTRRQALIDEHAPEADAPIDATGIKALAAAGMTIGFHTLHHPVLPNLSDAAIGAAVSEGRDRLAAVVGRPLEWFSYPHGKADERTVAQTRAAGYTHAWTTQPHLLRRDADPYRHGRWDPLPASTDDMLISLGSLLRREQARDGRTAHSR